MRVSILIIPFFVFYSNLIGQETSTLPSFLKNFKKVELPVCFNYSYDEQVSFGAIYEMDSLVYKEGDSVYVEYEDVMVENDYKRKDSNWLEIDDAAKYLIPESDFLYEFSKDLTDTLLAQSMDEYLESSFCALDLLFETELYYLVSYERIFDHRYFDASEKYLATISKDGNFISRVKMASFMYLGTGTSWSGGKIPWFGQDRGCIDEEMKIRTEAEQRSTSYWRINKQGAIFSLK